MIDTPASERTIHWFWEPTGNQGKSFLTNYLVWKKLAVKVNGAGKDLAYMLLTAIQKNEEIEQFVILDIPRDQGNNVSYQKLEELSDGILTSTKYESDNLYLPPMHKLVFANMPPEQARLSDDRLCVIEINKKSIFL